MLYMQRSFDSQLPQASDAETTSNHAELALMGFQAELKGDLKEAIRHYQKSNHPVAKERLNEIVPAYLSITYPGYCPPHTSQQPSSVRSPLEPKKELITPTTEVNNPKEKRRQKRKTEHDPNQYTKEDVDKCILELWDGDIKLLTDIQKISGELTQKKFAFQLNRALKDLNTILARLKRKGLLARWPSLTPFGNDVVNTANSQQSSQSLISTPAKSYLPLQQLSQTRASAKAPQLEQPPMEPSKDAIRIRIQNLI